MHAWQKYGVLGGHPALVFVNTIDDQGKTRDQTGLPDWPTTLEWALAAGLLTPRESEILAAESASDIEQAELASLHELREQLWRVLRAVAADQTADQHDIQAVDQAVNWSMRHAVLEQSPHGLRWHVKNNNGTTAILRTRIALWVNDLIVQAPLDNLAECGRCTALFLNQGRGKGRRWCRMKTCGNRAKIERFRNRLS